MVMKSLICPGFLLAPAMAGVLCLLVAGQAAGAPPAQDRPASPAEARASAPPQSPVPPEAQAPAPPEAPPAAQPEAAAKDLPEEPAGRRQTATPAQKEEARDHYVSGNELLRTASFGEAVAEYHLALRHWQHPRIYYNLGIALINLDRPVEAYDAMSAAVRSGAALGTTLREQAVQYQQLLRRQIGEIVVVCAEPGTRVTMNGKALFEGPGEFRSRVQVGRYQIVASKPDFLPATSSVAILPHRQVAAEISMRSRDDAMVRERRIERTWVPWAVAGIGGAVLATGGLMHFQSYGMYEKADNDFKTVCGSGCRDDDAMGGPLVDRMETAGWLQRIAVGSYVVGGTAAVAGLVLAYLNQPEVTRLERSDIRTSTTVSPVVSKDVIGVQGAWSY